MKRLLTILAALLAVYAAQGRDPRAVCFNDGWRFILGDSPAYSAPDCDDSGWRSLTLPHDWAIEGDFSIDNPSGTGGGALPGGVGWYRKTFTADPEWTGRQIYLDFDGAYMNATVYVNGVELGTRPYGYASFHYDITPFLHDGANTVAVRVDNAEQPNSRWYSGCGIYRNVWLRALKPVHVAKDGTYVRTHPMPGSPDSHVVDIEAEIDNCGAKAGNYTVTTEIMDRDGKILAGEVRRLCIPAGQTGARFDCSLVFPNPRLWSTRTPVMYDVVTTIRRGNEVVDSYTTPFGVRTFAFDAETGFSLNGVPMKINGVCMHHDQGALGAAVNTAAIERQLRILKEMGANAYRCSHNPPAPEVLDLCDRMGFLVMDEAFDMWRRRKTSHDYSRYFDRWHERDLADMVRRDRNHPSVIMWSIGNEVLEQWSDARADTLSLEQANMILNFGHSADMLAPDGSELSVNSLLARKLADMTRSLDPTRPVTAGCNEPAPGNHLFRSGALDIIGYNYHDEWFKDVPANFPGKPFIITESVSALQTRGYYRMPSDSVMLWPVRWDIPFHDESFSCSSYDNCHAPWGNCHEGTMRHVKNNPFISGQFVWTGFDYIGEPTPFGWPARSSYFGIVDLAGFPKDVYYMYQSEWRPEIDVLHLFPHWNHTEGEQVDMWCYYNNADEVELYVNGRSEGVRTKGPDDLHVAWRVTYEPGDVRVLARKDDKLIGEHTIHTAGEPYALRLTPDREWIGADGTDLCFVTAEVVDRRGVVCPLADNLIEFAVTGAGRNAGVDNGCPISLERFKADCRHTFNGKALLIVQNDGNAGDIDVTATSAGLQPMTITISAK